MHQCIIPNIYFYFIIFTIGKKLYHSLQRIFQDLLLINYEYSINPVYLHLYQFIVQLAITTVILLLLSTNTVIYLAEFHRLLKYNNDSEITFAVAEFNTFIITEDPQYFFNQLKPVIFCHSLRTVNSEFVLVHAQKVNARVPLLIGQPIFKFSFFSIFFNFIFVYSLRVSRRRH